MGIDFISTTTTTTTTVTFFIIFRIHMNTDKSNKKQSSSTKNSTTKPTTEIPSVKPSTSSSTTSKTEMAAATGLAIASAIPAVISLFKKDDGDAKQAAEHNRLMESMKTQQATAMANLQAEFKKDRESDQARFDEQVRKNEEAQAVWQKRIDAKDESARIEKKKLEDDLEKKQKKFEAESNKRFDDYSVFKFSN